jgi:zinc-binding alcohol dehydrogenase/oxidoreductase
MKAILLHEIGDSDGMRLEEWPVPAPQVGEVLIRLHAAAINHRDVWIRRGQYAGIRLPVILGSDGAGTVVDAGDSQSAAWIGRDVVIDPSLGWGEDARVQSPGLSVLGMPEHGTYAEYVKVPAANLHIKPAHLTMEQAAAVPLASVTAFRAVAIRGRAQAGEVAVVTGIGGGVALAALAIANHLGVAVYVTSSSDEKVSAACKHGAGGGANYRDPAWPRVLISQIGRRPDLVIDGAGGETFNQVLDLVRPGGRVISYGSTLGAAPSVEVRRIFWKQLEVRGTTMGSKADFAEMLKLYSAGLCPLVDSVYELEDAAAAHARMERGEQFGKIVLRVS